MTTVVNVVVERRHGKLYPARLDPAEQERAIDLCHQLRCEQGLPYRRVQVQLREHGVVRSLGWCHRTVALWWCPLCKDAAP